MDAGRSGERTSTRHRAAVAAVGVLWFGYTALQALAARGHVSENWSLVLGILPGVLGVGALLAAGLPRERLYLRWGRLSWPGLAVLVAVAALALGAVLPLGEWRGWNWVAALVQAPAGGVAQELFFRSALLPATGLVMGKRPWLTIVAHSALFGLWHIGPVFAGAPVWAILAVMMVPFVCGIGWGWQVRRDGTVVWAMVQHSLIWVIGLQFPMVE